jgi:hypothetical protein
VIVAAVIAIIIGGGIFGYSKYSDWRAKVAAQDAALKDAKKSVAEETTGTEYFLNLPTMIAV